MEDESNVKTKIVGVISTRMGADGLEYLLRNEERTGGPTEWVAAHNLPEHVFLRGFNDPGNSSSRSAALAHFDNDTFAGNAGVPREPEKIVAVTFKDGVTYMGLKWKGEAVAEFINVKEIATKWPLVLIKFYESNLVIMERDRDNVELVEEKDLDDFVEASKQHMPEEHGVPKEIVAAVKSKGKVFLIVRWEGIESLGSVEAAVAHRLFPQQLISFYESHIVWN